ncbi:MAG: BREX-4 system phosphatase PglZ [Eubacteriales bacterium]
MVALEYTQIALEDLLQIVEADQEEKRLVCRIFFTENLETYSSLVETLSKKADITVKLSDPNYCKGEDTIPDLTAVVGFLEKHKDETILIPHLGEYLRVASSVERCNFNLHGLLNRHVHSCKRIWLPIFAGKTLFESLVGDLGDERFSDAFYELTEPPSSFRVEILGGIFKEHQLQVDANGLRNWFKLWDRGLATAEMSFSTRYAKEFRPVVGNYTLEIVTDPFDYLTRWVQTSGAPLEKNYGTPEQWASLVPYVRKSKGNLSDVICRAFNILQFNPKQILGQWSTLTANHRWLFFLWFKLSLNSDRDYISSAVKQCSNIEELSQSLECFIFSCLEHPYFLEFALQREEALKFLGVTSYSQEFWQAFRGLENPKEKFALLTNRTLEERTCMVELVSKILQQGETLETYQDVLKEKYPEFVLYMKESKYLKGDLLDYIQAYKTSKIADTYSEECAEQAEKYDIIAHRSRGEILYQLKNQFDAYYLWIDGLGVEWIDLLLEKIQKKDQSLKNPAVHVAAALIPTVTSVNMAKVTDDIISEKKFDLFDSLSHIKDKSETNYQAVVAKQLDMMNTIADLVVKVAAANPKKDIVITSDHGLSRLAALGFHKTEGIAVPPQGEVRNLGRYCVLSSEGSCGVIPRTMRNKEVIAFKTYHHFTCSGYAPGEIHGGATPEEALVPVIHFKRGNRKRNEPTAAASYHIEGKEVFLDVKREACFVFTTTGVVTEATVQVGSNTYSAMATKGDRWSVYLPGLDLDQVYSIYIHLNGVLCQKEETIQVKRKGMEIDDDF